MDYKLETKAQREYPVIAHYLGGSDIVQRLVKAAAQNAIAKDGTLSPIRAREIAAGIVWGAYSREWLSLEDKTQTQWQTLSNDYFELYDQILIAEDRQTIQAILVKLTGTRTLLQDMA